MYFTPTLGPGQDFGRGEDEETAARVEHGLKDFIASTADYRYAVCPKGALEEVEPREGPDRAPIRGREGD